MVISSRPAPIASPLRWNIWTSSSGIALRGKIRLCNVLQGNTQAQTDTWYEAAKGYAFEGWAFAGRLRHNIYSFIRRIFIMERDGLHPGSRLASMCSAPANWIPPCC
jgi:hypothetical protein